MWRRWSFALMFGLCAIALPQMARASCTATITDLDFGVISVRGGAAPTTAGTVTIRCSGLLSGFYNTCLRLGAGTGGSAGGGVRYMKRADGETLAYELTLNGNPWTSGGLLQFVLSVLLGPVTREVDVEARITSLGSGVKGGAYSSTFPTGGGIGIELTYGLLVGCGPSGSVNAFTVKATVVPSCEIFVTPLDFGIIDADVRAPVDAEAMISVACSDQTPYVITLDPGTGAGVSDPANRKMMNSGQPLHYGLYQTPARTQAWGWSPGNGYAGTGTGANQNVMVYGRIHSGQTATVGTYSDSVVVTITY